MMLEHLGWMETAETIPRAIGEAVKAGRVTYDVARRIEGVTVVRCSEFAEEIVKRL
jgi:isocitrate dehydrogenase